MDRAVSGFHALVASGTTPKLIGNERDVRLIGYGSMALESRVAIMALIAATLLDPGVYFAINVSTGVVGAAPQAAVRAISAWGFPVTAQQMASLANDMGESTLFARSGGAPSLAVGMASVFGSTCGRGLPSVWYHFAIMFEAVFILTTVEDDAYERYVAHHRSHHAAEPLLTLKAHFDERQRRKWLGVSRCC